jgi:PAS domain S-box-containing protein
MFEIAPVGITTLDFERRRYLTANESFQRMTGYTEAELRNLTTLEITHEDDRAAMQQRIDSRTVGVLQRKRYRRKDGQVVWADITSFVVPATDSTPAFRGTVAVDITDRKRAEDALRRSEAYLNEVFETLPDGVAIIGRDYRYQRVNPIYERRTGLTRGQIAGLHVADVNGVEAFNETIKRELDRCCAGEHVSYGDWFTHAASGRRYLAVTYSPLFVSGSKLPGAVLAITRDLTDYMLASEALQQAQADLERLSRVMMLGEMTASIAHEVNQPIAAVITNANAGLRWLGVQRPDLDEVRQALARIARDGTRAGDVIGRIRALVKKVPPRRELLDINQAIREVIPLTQTEMQRNHVKLQSRLADDLPLVSVDRVQLQQVMINLIVNAIEAMADAGDGPRELTIASGIDDANDVVVEVRDIGPGLEPEQLDRLFQSFYTTKPDGIGMGLAISRSIAEAHGGRLSAAPNNPRGAVFRLTLPLEQPLSGTESDRAPSRRSA